MPYKSEKLKLAENQDRRRKLTQEDKQVIAQLYATGQYSLNTLATKYGVSKKLVLITVNPVSKLKSDNHIQANWKKYQKPKEERAKVIREHRRYKQNLYLKGDLK